MDSSTKKKNVSHSSSPDWSVLPMDLLITISNKIKDIADFSVYRSICKSWNLASRKSTFKSSQTPWLLLPYDSRKTTRSFLNPSSKAIYNFDIPEARDRAIIGSSNGWLVLINKNFNLTIVNPITRAQVDHYIPQLTYFKLITKVNSSQRLSFIAENLRCYIYMSPNYPGSSSDCVLAFSVKWYKHVLFCKIGDKSWTTIKCLPRNICSLAYHKGKIYAVCEGTGYVGVSDPKSDSMVMKSINVPHSCFSYFVKREDELLLLVDRRSDEDYDYDDCLEFSDFDVYKLKGSSHISDSDSSDSNTDYEDDSDYNCCYSFSDDGDVSDKHCDSNSGCCGSYDSEDDEGFADYIDGDFDDSYVQASDDTWLEYSGLSDYTIFFTSEVVSTVFSHDTSYFKGKSICYPSNEGRDGYLDGIEVFDLDEQTEETDNYSGDQRICCPRELKLIWFSPSL